VAPAVLKLICLCDGQQLLSVSSDQNDRTPQAPNFARGSRDYNRVRKIKILIVCLRMHDCRKSAGERHDIDFPADQLFQITPLASDVNRHKLRGLKARVKI